MASAMQGFVTHDCDDDLAARLRREVQEANGAGYDLFEFNTFDVELFYGEDRVLVRDTAALGFNDVQLTIHDFLAELPDVPMGPRMHGRPRPVTPLPPPDR